MPGQYLFPLSVFRQTQAPLLLWEWSVFACQGWSLTPQHTDPAWPDMLLAGALMQGALQAAGWDVPGDVGAIPVPLTSAKYQDSGSSCWSSSINASALQRPEGIHLMPDPDTKMTWVRVIPAW